MNAEFHDRTVTCVACKGTFEFTAGAQEFFAGRGFSEPRRCKPCREARKTKGGRPPGANSGSRRETHITCSRCGQQSAVPFKPTPGRAVYCGECFEQRRAAEAAT